jgi:hypothetical protein
VHHARARATHPFRTAAGTHGARLGRCNLILQQSVVSSRSPRVTHSFYYAGAPYKYLYGGAPYKSPKIAENRAARGGCSSLPARAADTYRQKSLNCRKKRRLRRIFEVQPDLRGSLIVPPTVKSNCAGPDDTHAPRARPEVNLPCDLETLFIRRPVISGVNFS